MSDQELRLFHPAEQSGEPEDWSAEEIEQAYRRALGAIEAFEAADAEHFGPAATAHCRVDLSPHDSAPSRRDQNAPRRRPRRLRWRPRHAGRPARFPRPTSPPVRPTAPQDGTAVTPDRSWTRLLREHCRTPADGGRTHRNRGIYDRFGPATQARIRRSRDGDGAV